MNNNRLRRQHSITSVQDRRAATTTAATAVAQCRRTDFGGGGGGGVNARRARATGQSVFYDDHGDTTMAASVAMLERFQQPASAVTTAAPPATAMAAADGDRSLRHRHYRDGCRPHHATKYNSVSAGSALSKSMRYADGWLYERDAGGTVGHGRGGGVRHGKARSTFLGREHFGTAAAAAAVAAAAAAAAVAANAVPEDPYERVRKNRMAGATAAAAGKHDRKRNRSSSPRTPSPDYDDTGGVNLTSSSSRRSILECNVNPYDLLRQPDDDDDYDDDQDQSSPRRLSLKDKFMNRIQDTVVFTKSKSTSVGGFGSFSYNGSTKKAATAADRTNSGVNIAGHTVSALHHSVNYFHSQTVNISTL